MEATTCFIKHLGRRSASLILFGLLWAGVGSGILAIPLARFTSGPQTGYLYFMENPLWGFMWIAGGVFAAACGLLRRSHSRWDEWGFNSLLIGPMVWAAAYAWSWIAAIVTNGEIGRYGAWAGFMAFGIAIFSVLLIAGWPEPEEIKGDDSE